MPQKQPPANTAVCFPDIEASGASTDALGRVTLPSALARFPLAANAKNAIAATAVRAAILKTIADLLVTVLIPSPRSRLDSHEQQKLQALALCHPELVR
jgi:hypothetical protein